MFIHLLVNITDRDDNGLRTLNDILDDDTLLGIFKFYRHQLAFFEEDGSEVGNDIALAGGRWEREHWWYKLAQVCQRWRRLILEFPSHLGLSLVCTAGTPVAEMLNHSPPLPLIIDHLHTYRIITVDDEDGINRALQRRDRVRRIRLRMGVRTLKRLIKLINEEFPMLEYLYIEPLNKHNSLSLPGTLQAPRLRHLVLFNFTFQIGSPILDDLVTLSLENIDTSTYFDVNELFQRLSHMPQLETLRISFHSSLSDKDVERNLSQRPPSTDVTLPNLRWFGFGGASAYMKAVLPRTTIPFLKVIEVMFFNQPSDSMLFILQFLCKTKSPRFRNIRVTFYRQHVVVMMYPHERTGMHAIRMRIICGHLYMQVASTAEIFNGIRIVFAEAESLILEHEASLRWHNGLESPDHTQWRELFRSFNHVKSLYVCGTLVEELSRSLRPEYGESFAELLPELKTVSYSASHYAAAGESFEPTEPFIRLHGNLGFPVTLVPTIETHTPLCGDTVVVSSR